MWLKYVPGIVFRTDNEPFKVGCLASPNPIIIIIPFFSLSHSSSWKERMMSPYSLLVIILRKGGNAKVHGENSRIDEVRESVPAPGRPHYPLPGKLTIPPAPHPTILVLFVWIYLLQSGFGLKILFFFFFFWLVVGDCGR